MFAYSVKEIIWHSYRYRLPSRTSNESLLGFTSLKYPNRRSITPAEMVDDPLTIPKESFRRYKTVLVAKNYHTYRCTNLYDRSFPRLSRFNLVLFRLIAHKLVEPLEDLMMPAKRVTRLEYPMILIGEQEDSARHAAPIINSTNGSRKRIEKRKTHSCRAWNAPIPSVSGKR